MFVVGPLAVVWIDNKTVHIFVFSFLWLMLNILNESKTMNRFKQRSSVTQIKARSKSIFIHGKLLIKVLRTCNREN